MIQDHYVTLECCHHLGNVLGSLPSGDITDPTQTSRDSDVAQFSPYIIVSDYVIIMSCDYYIIIMSCDHYIIIMSCDHYCIVKN